jgi:hypothetical protein
MESTDLTIEILKDIRTEIRATNTRIDATNARLDTTVDRLDQTIVRVDLLHEGQLRLATEVVGVASAVRELSDLLREDRALKQRVDDHETRITAIERRPRTS